MSGAREVLTLLLCSLIGTALGATAPVARVQITRQLQQADPFSQFLDTTPAAGAPGAPAPSDAPAVNTDGVPAAANSATTVPVLGSPYSAYPQQQTVAPQQATYQQQLAAQQQAAYQQQLAAQQQAYGAQQPAAAYPGTAAAAQPGATAQPVAPAVDRTQPVYAPAPAAVPTPAAAAVPTPAAAAALTPAAAPAPAPATAAALTPAAAPAPAAAAAVPAADTAVAAPVLPPTLAPAPKAEPALASKPVAKAAKAPEPAAPSPPPPRPPTPPPSPPPSPPPPNPPPPYPPGMIQRSELTNQIPANTTALRSTKILLPEGTAKHFSFAWVCDAKGGLYLSVNKENMITCGKGTIDLSQTLKIKGAKPITCPDTGKACPGNTAVTIFSKFANTAEQFKAQQSSYINGVAKAASVSPMQVVVTNVKLLYKPKSPPTAEPAAGKAVPAALTGAPPADKKAPPASDEIAKPTKGTAAKPSSGTAQPESALVPRLSRLLRRLLAETPTKGTDKPSAAAKKVSLDAEAVVEELPGGPKPLIEVTTSIQPLTQSEAESVLGTTSSPYFISTYKDTLANANLTSTEDIAVKIAEPAKEYDWPEPVLPKNATMAATNTTRGIIPIPEVQEPALNATLSTPTDITPANDTTNTTQPATSNANRRSLNVAATVAAVVLATVMAL